MSKNTEITLEERRARGFKNAERVLASVEDILDTEKPRDYSLTLRIEALINGASSEFLHEVYTAIKETEPIVGIPSREECPFVWRTTMGNLNLQKMLDPITKNRDSFSPYTFVKPRSDAEDFLPLLERLNWSEGKIAVAGGYALRVLLGKDFIDENKEKWGTGDVDIWARGKEAARGVCVEVERWAAEQKGTYTIAEFGGVTKYEACDGSWAVDVITIKENFTFDLLVSTFDIFICQAYFVLTDSGIRVTAMRDIMCPHVVICPVCELLCQVRNRSCERMQRYRQRGAGHLRPVVDLCEGHRERAITWSTFAADDAVLKDNAVFQRLPAQSTTRLTMLTEQENNIKDIDRYQRLPLTPEQRRIVDQLYDMYAQADMGVKHRKTAGEDIPETEMEKLAEIRNKIDKYLDSARKGEELKFDPVEYEQTDEDVVIAPKAEKISRIPMFEDEEDEEIEFVGKRRVVGAPEEAEADAPDEEEDSDTEDEDTDDED